MTKRAGELGARLRAARLAHQPPLTLRQVGGDHLSVPMISRLERGDVMPSLESLFYLADRLGVSVASLVDPEFEKDQATRRTLDRGEALLDLQRPEEALVEFRAAGAGSWAVFGQIQALTRLGRVETAAALLTALNHADHTYHRATAEVALAQGQYRQALDHLVQATSHGKNIADAAQAPGPRDTRTAAELLFLQGRVHEQLGNKETARLQYQRALDLIRGITSPDAMAAAVKHPSGHASAEPSALALATATLAGLARLDTSIRIALGMLHVAMGRFRE